MHNNSREKRLEVEEHHRNVRLPKNKTSVTACNDSLNAKTLNVKPVSAMCDKCVLIDKHDMCVLKSVVKPLTETVASESNKKPRNNVRKLYERLRKIYKWSYIKFTPSGYMWKPKSPTGHVNPNVSLPLDNVSKTANVLKTKTSRWSNEVNVFYSGFKGKRSSNRQQRRECLFDAAEVGNSLGGVCLRVLAATTRERLVWT
nr:hypothetical protein [Tanacetum cinerariifolium]